MVKVYSTPSCPYCVMAKQFLKSQGVEYEDIDVSQDEAQAQDMINKSGQMGVPVLDVNGTIIIGFNKAQILKALGK